MKRTLQCSESFQDWYNFKLTDRDREVVNDIAEHSVIDLDNASEAELSYIRNRFETRQEDELRDAEKLVNELQIWARGTTKRFKKFERGSLDKGYVYFEKHSIEDMIRNYIKYFNRNVDDYGNGFESDWDDDDWMYILYKNGKIREINPEADDGTKKISIDGIDSIILNGSWGTAIAGPSIAFEDYTVYDDIIDIRAEFLV